MYFGASAVGADARRRDAGDAAAYLPGAATKRMPPRPSGLGSAETLALLHAPYIPQRVCASLPPGQRPWGPQQSVSAIS